MICFNGKYEQADNYDQEINDHDHYIATKQPSIQRIK